MNAFSNLKNIVEGILGKPKREIENGTWYEYDCPVCAEEKGVEHDNKYNLAVNYESNYFHCWRCGYSGKIARLVKKYGTVLQYNEFRQEMQSLHQSYLYKLDDGRSVFDDEDDKETYTDEITLPQGFKPLKKDAYGSMYAWDYITSRGITEEIIDRFSIGFIPNDRNVEDKVLRNRIIIPSYNEFGELNYWVGRDYTERSFMRYKNPDVKKTELVFNEGKINWYEDVTLVEGPFDHIVVPNSIPLLGKTLKSDYAVYMALIDKLHANVNILLDDDAFKDAVEIYRLLENSTLKGKVRIIECPIGYDASFLYQILGRKGIIKLLATAHRLDDYTLSMK